MTSPPLTAGIAGAGLMGRLLGVSLVRLGWMVTLFDRDHQDGKDSCGATGAGMLAPWCELESSEPIVAQWGCEALDRWPELLAELETPVPFHRNGSLVVAHAADAGELRRLQRRIEGSALDKEGLKVLTEDAIAEREPALAGRFSRGLWFPREGHIDNRALLSALAVTLKRMGVIWHERCPVDQLAPGKLVAANNTWEFDWVFDCRGLGAAEAFPDLRGVRGELLELHAPEVTLQRPVRIMHPRYPLYIVPRPDHHFLVGATTIESHDCSPISVRSTLELLSAAYTLHPGFAEARIVESRVNCRPAFPDNLPRIDAKPGMIRVNGLYRHGFLLSPILLHRVLDRIHETGKKDAARQATYADTAQR